MATENDSGENSETSPVERDTPEVEPRRSRAVDTMATYLRGRLAAFSPRQQTGILASLTSTKAGMGFTGGRGLPIHGRSIPTLHVSGVPAIYLIEREAIRLRRQRVEQFKLLDSERTSGLRVEFTHVNLEISDELKQYARPPQDSSQDQSKPKNFLQRLQKLVSLR
jgi:hypothetical protein